MLDPQKVAERAYKSYFSYSCMYASFEAVVGELADKHGEPYSSFPFAMMAYGSSGVAGWGALCGALNGAAAIQLLSHNLKAVISELYRWHEITPLPNINLAINEDKNGLFPASKVVKASVSNSVLCHIIVSKWEKESGLSISSSERKQRCAYASASVAKKTSELLNEERNGIFKPIYPLSDSTQACSKCHVEKSSLLKDTKGKMDCLSCHTDHTK